METLLLDLEEAQATLRIRRSLLYSLLSKGELKAVKIGRRRLIERAEIAAYIAHLKAEQAQEQGR